MSSNRYSALNRRPGAASSSLFQDYPGNNNSSSRPSSTASQTRSSYAYPTASPRPSSPYSSNPQSYNDVSNNNPYPFANTNTSRAFHPANPNSKGQYSASVLESLEAQNDTTQTTILSQKVSQLKSLTIAIGDEIRDSSTLAGQINDTFENTGVRLKGTMRRMLRMAEKTGVGWKVWLGFFVAVWLLFAYVWLF